MTCSQERVPTRGGNNLYVQIIIFLLFIGAEKLVNRAVQRPLMNGSAWYLVAASIMFVLALMHIHSVVPPGDGGMYAEQVGTLIGNFALPAGAAIYYARKFSRQRAAAAESTAAL